MRIMKQDAAAFTTSASLSKTTLTSSSTNPLKFVTNLYKIPSALTARSSSKHQAKTVVGAASLGKSGNDASSGGTYPKFINLESLRLASSNIKDMRNEVVMYFNAFEELLEQLSREGVKGEKRFIVSPHSLYSHLRQVAEQQSQVRELYEISASLSHKRNAKHSNLAERLVKLHRNFLVLSRRGEAVLQLSSDLACPKLNSEEIKWKAELDKLNTAVRVELNPLLTQVRERWVEGPTVGGIF